MKPEDRYSNADVAARVAALHAAVKRSATLLAKSPVKRHVPAAKRNVSFDNLNRQMAALTAVIRAKELAEHARTHAGKRVYVTRHPAAPPSLRPVVVRFNPRA